MSKFIVKRGSSRKWYWNFVARNGEIVATSQRYRSRQGALKGAKSIMKNAAKAKIEVVK